MGCDDVWQVDNKIYFHADVDAESTKQLLKLLDGSKDIELHIRSNGGELYPAFGLYNTIREYPKHITTIIDGTVASSATVLWLAGHTKIMHSTCLFRPHQIYYTVEGSFTECTNGYKDLISIKNILVKIYQENTTKIDEDKILSLMENSTVLTSDEMVELGFL